MSVATQGSATRAWREERSRASGPPSARRTGGPGVHREEEWRGGGGGAKQGEGRREEEGGEGRRQGKGGSREERSRESEAGATKHMGADQRPAWTVQAPCTGHRLLAEALE